MESTLRLPILETRTRLLAVIGFLAALVFASASAPAQEAAEDPEGAKAFISKLSSDAVAVWQDPTLTEAQREERFRDLLHEGFAVDFIARLVIGRHWRTATPDQRESYMELFPPYIVNTFARRLGDYGNEELKVLGTAPAGQRDLFVRSQIIRPNAEPIAADWRIRKFDDTYQIVDIKVEGISMAITQRDEFSSIVGKDGFDGLLRTLRNGAEIETAQVQ